MGDPLGKAGDWATQTFLRRVLSLGAFWTQMRGLSWVALSLRDGFSFKLAFADALPYATTRFWPRPGRSPGWRVRQSCRHRGLRKLEEQDLLHGGVGACRTCWGPLGGRVSQDSGRPL